jgi:hypothetical protein
MAGRGPQSFKKRQKEQQRKEKQLEKAQKRVERKTNPINAEEEELVVLDRPLILPEFMDDPEDTDDADDAEAGAPSSRPVVSKV